MARTVIGAVVAVVLVIAGYAVWQVARLGFGIQRSDILEGKATGEEMNILLMGLDSRLDMNGKVLSPELYDKLHSGDASSGGNIRLYGNLSAPIVISQGDVARIAVGGSGITMTLD